MWIFNLNSTRWKDRRCWQRKEFFTVIHLWHSLNSWRTRGSFLCCGRITRHADNMHCSNNMCNIIKHLAKYSTTRAMPWNFRTWSRITKDIGVTYRKHITYTLRCDQVCDEYLRILSLICISACMRSQVTQVAATVSRVSLYTNVYLQETLCSLYRTIWSGIWRI